MTRACLLALLATSLLVAGEAPKPAAPATVLSVVTDKPEALYAVKDTARFRISLATAGTPVVGRSLKWVIARDGIAKPLSGSIVSAVEPVVVETTLDQPGFALCTVTAADDAALTARAGAGFSPLEVKASAQPPEDFDAFWAAKKAELAKLPMNPQLTPVEVDAAQKGKVELFDLRLDCLGGMPVSGYYARPVGAAKGSCPAVVSYHGAGVRSSNRPIGTATGGRIGLDINAHGIDNGKDKAFYDELSAGRLKGYPGFGKEDREKTYFLGMFLRLVRSLEFIKAQPEWDGRILVVTGGSQGGAQALVAAGIDPQVTFCAAHVPAMCDHQSVLLNRAGTWPRWIGMKDGAASDPAVLAASRYFDPAFFALRSKAESLVSVGLIDTTCPPVTVYAAYNNLPGKKSIIVRPLDGHNIAGEVYAQAGKAIDAHIAAMRAAAK